MPYFCFVHRRSQAAPYFEVLPDMSRLSAIERAGALLAERPDGERAELWDGERLVFTLPRAATIAAPSSAG
ncbi:MAG: hypothetical protein JWP49_500 [Phenylobacterium sp.]|jgi:hypothetical protein|nr:hypothetical protein [Phenylobacterium sp.]